MGGDDILDRVMRKAFPKRECLKGELNEVGEHTIGSMLGNRGQRGGETGLKTHSFFTAEV